MSLEILMPALSPTMTEGNINKWLVKVGDKVKAGDIIKTHVEYNLPDAARRVEFIVKVKSFLANSKILLKSSKLKVKIEEKDIPGLQKTTVY